MSYFKGSEDHQMDFGVYELGSKKTLWLAGREGGRGDGDADKIYAT